MVFAQKMQAIVFSFSDFLSKILSRRSPLTRTTSDSHPALKMEVLGQKSKSKMRFSVFRRNFCHAILDFREQQAILIRPDIPPRPIDCDKVYPLPVTRTDDDEDLPFFSSIANFFHFIGYPYQPDFRDSGVFSRASNACWWQKNSFLGRRVHRVFTVTV